MKDLPSLLFRKSLCNVMAIVAAALLSSTTWGQGCLPSPITSSLGVPGGNFPKVSGVASQRWNRDGVQSVCGVPRVQNPPFPATNTYDLYSIPIGGAGTYCVTVQLDVLELNNSNYMVAAHRNTFNPLDLTQNWLGDPGLSSGIPPTTSSFSVNVNSGDVLLVVVENVLTTGNGNAYELRITGVPCPKRASGTEKGSVLIFSDVEVKWDGAGAVTQDTFIQLTNDNNIGVDVQMFFINGDQPLDQQPPLPAVATERAHPGCNNVDNSIHLTADQPTYWSALRGAPGTGGLSPWTVLDPGTPPGRPDLDPGAAAGSRYLRGFIIAFAVDSANQQIKWNHLAGNATVVNYSDGSAFEYNAWAFQAVDPVLLTGAVVGVPGIINFDGFEYARGFDQLLMNFQAVGATAFSGPKLVTSNTDLTLHPLSHDLRENNGGPVTTKAKFDVWNQNEVKFSNAERCITCWYQALLGTWAPNANHFLRANLQTNVGKARIDGVQSPVVCNDPLFPSINASLLGVIDTRLVYDAGLAVAESGTNLFGLGYENAVIKYDVLGGSPPPANPAPQDNPAVGQNDQNGRHNSSNRAAVKPN